MDIQRFLTVDQVAKQTGVAVITVRRWIKSRSIPSVQPSGKGGRILIPAAAMEQLAMTDENQGTATAVPPADPADQPQSAPDAPLPGPRPAWMR